MTKEQIKIGQYYALSEASLELAPLWAGKWTHEEQQNSLFHHLKNFLYTGVA